ncbi:PDZ domain-containing protein [Rubrivirga sp. IMCC45206]|uniref:S41 family peptidase n=1 Tax=Rubrivirga sp. IMCC45206 TaxID=3391614 RepID=UPI00398FADF4
MRVVPALLLSLALAAGAGAQTLLLRQPTVSDRHIAFAYGGDLWTVGRDGGQARRVTTFPGVEADPHLSPDGAWLAFSGDYDGNTDVYVVPVGGGEPQRLTWHPGADRARGWTDDGRVLFISGRDNAPRPESAFFTIAPGDPMPARLPLPRGFEGDLRDGRLAYERIDRWDPEWRGYRGGQAQPIRILDLDTLDETTIPWSGTVDTEPVWLGETVYFLSDRDDAANVWSYDTATGTLRQRTFHADYDVKHLDAGGGTVVYEQAGGLHRLDPDGEPRPLAITATGDLPWARPHWEAVDDAVARVSLSPTGQRALVEARGEVFTVPVEHGDWRNLSRASGAADRDPSWSPDGRHVAWFSDASGEYQLMIGDPAGVEPARALDLPGPAFYYEPEWAPDAAHIAFTDTDRNLWVLDVASGAARRVDGDAFAHPERTLAPRWSPDGRYLAYARRGSNQLRRVVVYDTETGDTHAVTDGLSDAYSPAWDASGKYLYVLASTNLGVASGWLDMSAFGPDVTAAPYLIVLAADEPSPLLPRSDEEPVAAGEDDDEEGEDEEPAPVEIAFDGILHRTVALDLPDAPYTELLAGPAGVLFLAEAGDDGATLHRWSLEDREAAPFLTGVTAASVSHDGSKMAVGAGGGWRVVGTEAPPEPGDGALALGLRAEVDPAAEWAQIFDDAWRFQRDYFYAPNLHGADWDAVRAMYEPWLAHVRHRSDLTYLLDVLGGETSVGHSFTGGGDEPDVERVAVGLLGADVEVVDGRYRLARIYTAESWNPGLSAPLAAPGVDVSEGDFLVGVDGVELTAATSLYRPFAGTAGRQTVLHVNDRPTFVGARRVTVVPVASEAGLRQRAWVEDNRRFVDARSGGRLAYAWVPDTGDSGYESFNRYYFAQQDRDGAVVDERYNNGGTAADYIIDVLARERYGYFNNPVGDREPWSTPMAGIWGAKVMLINEMSGSGGDLLPYMFRARGLGPLVGTKTWGGLVGIWDTPSLVDGGYITAPRGGFYDLDGRWSVENEGVAPDVEVDITPRDWVDGRDPQLERAVDLALEMLDANPVERLAEPPPPVRSIRPAGR